ncbi:J46 / DnaJ domain-containing protein / JDP46 [Leishmania donovani]|uniref:DNAj-like_protein/GeneDB:LmjF.25.1100 n=1 Tax=Leishmania donovani TaxID=5661 RepID=A0A6J8FD93_LEIDO|nr:J46 / DnaJ domain-containing protein / JDP46 [Leishmania donovani]VDZ45306.1 DNAj-like_protein/GeneDB:LmjF.25.1100 [Leishmania donovani]
MRDRHITRVVAALLVLVWVAAFVAEVPVHMAGAADPRDEDAKAVDAVLRLPEDDFYAVLGLDEAREDATERDIKNAFRRLSKKYHPDVATGDQDSYRLVYQRVQRAYEILGDRRKRKIYDILGIDGVTRLEKPQQQQQQMNPFFAFFGVGQQADAERGKDMELLMVVPLEDIYRGAAHTSRFAKRKICRACKGTGARSGEDVVKCPHCQGRGRLAQRVQIAPGFVQQMEQVCPHCQGKGTHVAHMCPVCRGKMVLPGEAVLSVDIEEGLPEGHVLTYELEADQAPGQVPGDVLLTVVSAPHPVFHRSGNDLYANVSITLKEALLGFKKTFTHLDGHNVELHWDGVMQNTQQVRIAGEGMPRHHVPSERGDLYITYNVLLPAALTAEQRALFQEHFA